MVKYLFAPLLLLLPLLPVVCLFGRAEMTCFSWLILCRSCLWAGRGGGREYNLVLRNMPQR